MITYKIRSVALLQIVNDVKNGRLIPDAYFQRNIVWRDIHRKDFIETILLGFPFPQMFFSRGKIDLSKMETVSCIVDGQQRTDTIVRFVNSEFSVSNRFFRDFAEDEKEAFLNYEVGIVVLDLENDDPKIKEIFQRLNRTSNSLTSIEKLASEFAATEYMFVARLLANDVDFTNQNQLFTDEEDWRKDPDVPENLYLWAKEQSVSNFENLSNRLGVFTEREITRKVHIMYILNIMSTVIGGFFNRNEQTISLLEDYKDDFSDKDLIYEKLINTFKVIDSLQIINSNFWSAKSNFFSLCVGIANKVVENAEINVTVTRENLLSFAEAAPDDYLLAAREGVNNRKERVLRDQYVSPLICVRE